MSTAYYSNRKNATASCSPTKCQNVGEDEKLVSVGIGAALIGYGLSHHSLSGVLLASLGGCLIHRGVTGICPVYDSLKIDTSRPATSLPREASGSHDDDVPREGRRIVVGQPRSVGRDVVDESSIESFPASDPPSWAGGTEAGSAAIPVRKDQGHGTGLA